MAVENINFAQKYEVGIRLTNNGLLDYLAYV